MSEAKATKTRRDLEIAVVTKALKDDTFRKKLAADPRGAVTQVLAAEKPGAKLPDSLEVKAFEEPPNSFYLVIPHVASAAELSEADLERVAGGIWGGLIIST